MTQDINTIARDLAGGLSLDDLRRRASGEVMPIERREMTPEQAERAAKYWEQVFAPRPTRGQLYMTRNSAQEMEYEDARRKLWAILQMRAAHIATLENRPEFEWVFSDGDKARIKNMLKYFINDNSSIYALHKGLFVFGQNGTGKTELLQAFEKFTNDNELSKRFVFCSMSGIYTKTKSDAAHDPITPNVQNDRCFDEFLRYSGPVKRFGDDLDLNEAIIEQRYDRFKRYGQLTHIIANATPNEAEAAISPMIFDRLRSMCTSVHFEGQSKRG